MNWFKWIKLRRLVKRGFLNLELPNEYPVIEMTDEQKKKMCTDMMQIIGKPLVMIFKICDLKTHMWGTFYNEPTKEYFELTFRKVDPLTWKPPIEDNHLTPTPCSKDS